MMPCLFNADTTDFGTFVLLPPFLKTYLGRKKLTLGTFFQTSRTHIAVLLDAALLLGHDGDVREGRPTHPLHDGSHFVVDGRRYVAQRPQFTFEGRPLKLTETPESLSVYRNNYFQDLSRRMCSGLRRPINLTSDGTEAEFLSSTGDAIFVTQGSSQEQIIREQYTLVTEALRRAKRRGQRTGQIVATDDAWLTVEAAMFRFVEMLSEYVINPAQTMVNSTINS